MKILLFSVPAGRRELPKFPLGLAYIAGALKRHAVRVFDTNVVDKPFEKLSEIIEKDNPDIIGSSLPYIDTCSSYNKFSYYPSFVSCMKHIKRVKKNATVIVGGTGFTLFAKQIMEEVADIDFGVLSEGEDTIQELLDNLTRPQLVKGICYKNGRGVCFTDRRGFLNFDNLPSPRRDIVDISRYRYFPEQIGIQTKRGCIFRCIYCTYPYVGGNQVRTRSPKKVVDEIEKLTELGVEKIFINDSIFNYPQQHAIQICQEIIKRGIRIKWKALFNERFMDRRLFSVAKEAGCEVFIFGPDGGHPRTLKSLRKSFSYREMITAYNLFRRQNKVNFKCAFMFNGLDESIQTALSTLRLILILFFRGHFQFEIVNLRIYPHTELFYLSLRKGLIAKDDNLISHHYYNPFPLRIVSYLLNSIGGLLYSIKMFKRCRTADSMRKKA